MTASAAPAVRTASVEEHPCEVHTYHWPPVLETEGHHIYPVYLQKRVYGGRIEFPELVWVCDTGHKNIHTWLYFLLDERKRQPWRKGTKKEMAFVYEAFDWYDKERLNTGE